MIWNNIATIRWDSSRKLRQQITCRPEQPKPKKSGMGKGIIIGCLGTLLVGVVGVLGGCMLTGSRLIITDKDAFVVKENAVLDADSVSKLNELSAYIENYFYDDTDKEALQNGLYAGLVEGLNDKYSVYYTAEEYQQTKVGMTGKYYGIGAALSQDADSMVVTVSKIYEGTPSDEAGMQAGDTILSVDGTEATSMEVTDHVQLIRG